MRTTNGYKVSTAKEVELLDYMGDDSAVCDAARVSFNKEAVNYTTEQNTKLLKYLAKNDHWSPFAHTSLKFRFRAPMFIARQFQKHVVGFAWNEVSRRYVSNDPEFFIPQSFRKRPDNIKQGSVSEGDMPIEGAVLTAYVDQIREHAQDYKSMISQDICPEQVRMFMPQSMMTEWIWTGSLMAWARFCKLRGDSHAQQECWTYASKVRYEMEDLFPQATLALLGE